MNLGGDRVAGLMNAFRVEEDMPIESGMLTRFEGAQKKVETYYYDIRKQVFEYDEVMNNQRRAVYSERRRVLDGRALKKQVIGYGERTMSEIVEAYVNPDAPEWDLQQLVGKVKEFIYLWRISPLIRSRVWAWTSSRPSCRNSFVMPTTSRKVRSNSSGRADGRRSDFSFFSN